MKNLQIYAPCVDDSQLDMEFESGKQLIQELLTDDWGAPPKSLCIEASMDNGTKVTISIPYTDSDRVSVSIEKPE